MLAKPSQIEYQVDVTYNGNWVGVPHIRDGQWPEVEKREEVHAWSSASAQCAFEGNGIEQSRLPATKATAKARPTTRWFLKSSKGTIGWRANFHSQTPHVTRSVMPMRRVHRVYADVQGWVYPPACRATRLDAISVKYS